MRTFQKTLFSQDAFGKPSMGFQPLRLGQEDILEDITGILDDLTEPVVDLLNQLPPEALGVFRPKYDECKADIDAGGFSRAKGLKCMYDLFQEIKKYLREGPKPISTQPPAPPPRPTEEAGFPWIPVAIGAVAVIGIVVAIATAD